CSQIGHVKLSVLTPVSKHSSSKHSEHTTGTSSCPLGRGPAATAFLPPVDRRPLAAAFVTAELRPVFFFATGLPPRRAPGPDSNLGPRSCASASAGGPREPAAYNRPGRSS